MKLSATEKRIYALAQKWAKAGHTSNYIWGAPYKAAQRRACGRALLKLFKEHE